MSRLTQAMCILGGVLFAACGSAQVVSQTQTGGVIRLKGDRGKAMEEARGIMHQHCSGQYEITKQGETVIGSDTVRSDETYATEDSVVNEGGESTRQATEWRVTYQCAGAGPAPAPGPAPGPAPAPAPAPTDPPPPADPPPGDGY